MVKKKKRKSPSYHRNAMRYALATLKSSYKLFEMDKGVDTLITMRTELAIQKLEKSLGRAA